MTTTYRPILHIPAEAGERVPVGGYEVSIKLGSDDTGGVLTAIHSVFPPGTGTPPLHTHPEAELLYLFDGEWEVRTVTERGRESFRAGAGAFLYSPPGTPHQFVNVGSSAAQGIAIALPGGLDKYIHELRAVFGPNGTPDVEKLLAVQAKYGVHQLPD